MQARARRSRAAVRLGDEAAVVDDRVVARDEHAVRRDAGVDLDPAQPGGDRGAVATPSVFSRWPSTTPLPLPRWPQSTGTSTKTLSAGSAPSAPAGIFE